MNEYMACAFGLMALNSNGKEDSEEAETIREDMDKLWARLTTEEQKEVRRRIKYLNKP